MADRNHLNLPRLKAKDSCFYTTALVAPQAFKTVIPAAFIVIALL